MFFCYIIIKNLGGDVANEFSNKCKTNNYIVAKEKYFEDIGYEWLKNKESQIKQSSYYNYKFIVEKYLISYFGKKDIRKLHDFGDFIDELSTNLAPKTIRDIFNVLKMILTYYEETYNKKLKYKRTILPKIEKKEIEIFTSRERERIENYCIEQNKLYNLLKPISRKYKKEKFFLTGKIVYIEPRGYQDFFKNILKKTNVKKRNFHATRHTFATKCIEVGMDIKTLSKILGHANVQITMNTYVHSSKKQMKKYLERL